MSLKELLVYAKETDLGLLSAVYLNVDYISNSSLIDALLKEMTSILIDLGEEKNIDVDNLLLENLKKYHSELFEED